MSERPPVKRCAVYTRKSVEDGLEQEFNSLDAQRESAENYIASQRANGWICLPERYDDGGFSGGNMERPALKRLLDDADAGLIDIIIVYKIDRLSRSLADFADLSARLDAAGVSFVSVTHVTVPLCIHHKFSYRPIFTAISSGMTSILFWRTLDNRGLFSNIFFTASSLINQRLPVKVLS